MRAHRGLRLGMAAGLAMMLALPAARADCPGLAEMARDAAALIGRERVPQVPRGLSPADAQCRQDRLVAFLAQPWGDVVGHKLAPVGAAEQRRLGLDAPLRGSLFHATLRGRSGDALPARFGAAPGVQAGLLLRIGGDAVADAGADPVALLRQLDQVIPFLELPDLVEADAGGLRALNLGTRLGVQGEPVAVEATEDFARRLGAMALVLTDETGRELARIRPGAAMGMNPLGALSGLARELAAERRGLRAGDHVLLSGFAPALPAEPGRTYALRHEGLLPAGAPAASLTVRMQ